jgi:hypothetical protein
MRRLLLILFLASAPLSADDWGPLQFLIGKWTGEGGGGPGQGSGAFSFTPDIQNKILVRRNFAEYPPSNGKPALRHDDLMIVYRDEASHDFRAIYFDSEERMIQYLVKPVPNGVVFESAPSHSAPRYRLTNTSTGAGTMKIKFEIAPPGKDFTTYIEAAAHREKQ